MEFVGKPLAGSMLTNVASTALSECSEVLAAIPYAEHGTYEVLHFDECKRSKKKLTFYGRDDAKTPIAPKVLKWFLDHKSPNLSCRLVRHWLHAKVIWWVDAGVYIGSANLTYRAWFKNYEAGLYLTHAEIEQAGMTTELEAFFNGLEAESEDLTDEDYAFHLDMEKKRAKLLEQLREIEENAEKSNNKLARKHSAIEVDSRRTDEKRNANFRSEWSETLQKIRTIAHRVALPENRPHWVDPVSPSGVQADQFLHAYYYKHVRPNTEKDAYQREFEKHNRDPEKALFNALAWWKKSDFPYEHEQGTIAEAKRLRELFAKGRIKMLTKGEWVEALSRVYAFGDHANKLKNSDLGLGVDPGSHAKIVRMAELLYDQRTISEKFSAQEVVDFVIWGVGDVADRVWKADSTNKDYKVRHLGKSFYGEVVGWARPEEFPPRNSRSSKALRCLGFDVKVY